MIAHTSDLAKSSCKPSFPFWFLRYNTRVKNYLIIAHATLYFTYFYRLWHRSYSIRNNTCVDTSVICCRWHNGNLFVFYTSTEIFQVICAHNVFIFCPLNLVHMWRGTRDFIIVMKSYSLLSCANFQSPKDWSIYNVLKKKS
jgi:hypothetical protein